MINIIVVTHGEFGAYLVEAAEHIVGAQDGGVRSIPVSSRMPVERVKAAVTAAVAELNSSEGLIFLIDMPGGTPMNVVLPIVKDIPNTAVICGANINMVSTAFSCRGKMSFDALVKKIMEDGRKAVCEVKSLLLGGSAL